jgi:hypothetical protein
MTTQKRKLSEFAEPGMGGPEMGVPAAGGQEVVGAHEGGIDREGAMAKADLMKLASYASKLGDKIQDDTQLEAWVQAKITKAADYIASVYHFLEYEMKFSEYGHHLDNSDTLSESQKRVLKARLNEAKEKVRALKVAQAEKVAVEEGVLSGGDEPCAECGGTGVVHRPGAMVPDHVKSKVASYNRQAKAFHAASKRLDKNNNGIPDDEEMEEGFDSDSKEGDTFKTHTGGTATKTKTGVKHTAGKNYSGKGAADEEKKSKKDSDLEEGFDKDSKEGDTFKTHTGGTATKTKTGVKHTAGKNYSGKGASDEEKKSKKDSDLEEGFEKDAKPGDTFKTGTGGTATKTKTGLKHTAGKNYSGKAAEKEAKSKELDEGKPSAGLSKKEKSATVKKAKAGGDIGKPGKGFAKVAAKAAKEYGSKEKGEKVAAAAMWKNIKETTAYVMEKAADAKKAEKDYDGDGKIESGKEEHAGSVDKAIKAAKKTVKESTDFSRMQDQLARLNRSESHVLKESSEADQIRALTKRLLG